MQQLKWLGCAHHALLRTSVTNLLSSLHALHSLSFSNVISFNPLTKSCLIDLFNYFISI
jgi:hypothetical protein